MQDSIFFPLDKDEISLELHGSLVRRTVHPSGIRILTEKMPAARSVSIGFWVGVGSRDEQADRNDAPASLGSTHFLEHLLFKGTEDQNAYDIARAFDRMGADHNALTAKEYTSYYAKVRDVNLSEATTLLAHMVTDSILDEREFELERGVILEELAMAEDDLQDVAHETFFETVLDGHPLGRPIGGNPETIKTAQRDDVFRHYEDAYLPKTLVVTAAGAVDHEEFVELVLSRIAAAKASRWYTGENSAPDPRRDKETEDLRLLKEPKKQVVVHKPSEQTHLLLGTLGLKSGDDDGYALAVMNSVLGGGMSSRLFQEIREKRGFAYTAYSFGASYSDAGLFGMYAALAPERVDEVSQLMLNELHKIKEDGITEEEFERTLGQVAGSAALALEDSDTRMGRLARSELGTGEFIDLDASIARFEAVELADVKRVAANMLAKPMSLVAVGDSAAIRLNNGR